MNKPPSSDVPVARVVLASFIGTTIEWYDYFLYGTAAATIFNRLFFPELDPWAGTLAAFATYSVGFVARPLGGAVFGHFGDKLGRKSMLVTTLMLMGLATFAIGLLPTYSTIGFAAPVLLALLRFIQGFGVGGEWGGAVLMAVEHGHRGNRGLYAAWVQAGVPGGMLLAAGVFQLFSTNLSPEAFLSWGWRVPFLLGIALLGVGLFIRVQVFESPLFTNLDKQAKKPKLPILDVLRRYPKNVLLAIGARMAENACYYVFTIVVLAYVQEYVAAPEDAAGARTVLINGVLIASAVQFFVIPVFGILSDRLGRRPLYIGGAAALALFAYPFFLMINTGEPLVVYLAITISLIIHSAMYAPQAAFFSELFGTDVRYSGASVGYQLASPVAGGIAPLICMTLLQWSQGEPWPVAAYLAALAAVTMLSVYLAAETHRASLDD